MGKQDAYVILKLGKDTLKTSVKKDGGKNPIWNEVFDFSLLSNYELSLKMAERHVEETDFTCQAACELQPIIEDEKQRYDKQFLELFDKTGNVIGTITISIVQIQEFQIKSFNLKLNIAEAFLSKVTSDYFNERSAMIKVVWNEEQTFETEKAKFVANKAAWNTNFTHMINREDTIGFYIYEYDPESEKLYDDYIASAELDVDQVRSKKSFNKDLTLMSRKNKMLGALSINMETDLDEEDVAPVNSSFLQQSLDSSMGGGNSIRGLSRDMIRRSRQPKSSQSPQRQKNINESSLIELDNYLQDLTSNMGKYVETNAKLQDHYDKLKSKLEETSMRMESKKRHKPDVTEEEQELQIKLNYASKSLNKLQKESNTLKSHLNSDTAYDRIKELDNLIFMKRKDIFNLHKENDLVNEIIDRNEKILEETIEERGFGDKITELTTEINNYKKMLRICKKNLSKL